MDSSFNFSSFMMSGGFDQQPNVSFIGQCLDSPLIDTPLIKIQQVLQPHITQTRLKPTVNIKREKLFIQEVLKSMKIRRSAEPDIVWIPYSYEVVLHFTQLARDITNDKIIQPPQVISTELFTIVENFIKQQGRIRELPMTESSTITISDITLKYYTMYCEFRNVLDVRRQKSSEGNRKLIKTTIADYPVMLTENYFVVIIDQKYVYGSFDMFLCLHDVFRLRYGATIAADTLKKHEVTAEMIDKQYRWQEYVLHCYGNPGYEIIKAPESIYRCRVTVLSDGVVYEPNAYIRMIEKIKQKEIKLGRTENFCIDHFIWDVVEKFETTDACVEMFGLIKGTGHPIIIPSTGGQSSREHGKAPDKSRPAAVEECMWIFNHLLLTNYIKKHGIWPPMEFTSEKTALYQLWAWNQLYLADGSYPLSDWSTTSMLKIFDFDYMENYMDLVKDKACAPTISEMRDFYHGRPVDIGVRRILRNIMMAPKVDPKQLIHDFASDVLSMDEFNVTLAPKEKEFKLAARMYCLLTFKVRIILSIIQQNVKDSFFRYLPYQSMTMGETELMSKLLEMTATRRHADTLFIEIDLSRWNLCFRDTFVHSIGIRMDKMHGVSNYFGRIHEIFERSLVTVFVSDECIPGFTDTTVNADSDMQWLNHQGGFEGIDQATWTICTICMIYRALWGEDCSFILLGQGDNQTLAITRSASAIRKEAQGIFCRRIMGKIEQGCFEVNHEAKPEEFVESSTTLTYSKVFLIDGRIVPMEIKFAQSIAPLTSSQTPSIGDAIGAIYSAAIGSAMKAKDPLIHWRLALIHAEDTLLRFEKTGAWFGRHGKRLFSSITQEHKTLMMIIPSVIGGFPISSWMKFVIRHDPDPLGAALASLKPFMMQIPSVRQYLTYLITDEPYHTTEITYDKLIEDPHSLPFKTPSSQTGVLNSAAKSFLADDARNIEIKQLMNNSSVLACEQLKTTLLSMRPLFPSLAHDIWKISIGGKVDEIAKAFTLTKTIAGGVKQAGSLNQKLLNIELAITRSVITRFSESRLHAPVFRVINTFDLSEELRCKWQLGPSVLQGLSVYNPLDFEIFETNQDIHGLRCTAISAHTEIFSRQGPARPFLGGKTRERRIEKTYEIVKDTGVMELQKLVSAATAGGISESFKDCLNIVTSSRTPYPLSQLCELFPKTVGGIIAHRYEQLGTDGRIGPVGNLSIMSHLLFDTDHIPGVSGTKDDYPLAFQQFFSYLSYVQRLRALKSPTSPPSTILCQFGADNLKMLTQDNITVTDTTIPFDSQSLIDNKLVYIKELYGRELRIGHPESSTRTTSIKTLTDTTPGLHNFIVNLILIECSRRGPTSYRLDSNELYSPTVTSVDAPAFDAIGSAMFYSASIQAVSILSVTSFLQTWGPNQVRRELFGVTERWATIVADLWSPHLARANCDLNSLFDSGKIERGIGRFTASIMTRLQRSIVIDAYDALQGPSDHWSTLDLFFFDKSPTYQFKNPFIMSLSICMWTVYRRSNGGLHIRDVREAIGRFIGGIKNTEKDAKLEAETTRFALIAQSQVLLKLNQRILDPIINHLLDLGINGAININESVVECWRFCRNLPMNDLTKRFRRMNQAQHITGPFQYTSDISSESNPIAYTIFIAGEQRQSINKFDQLLDDNQYNIKPSIYNHLHLPGGVWSCDGLLWSCVPGLTGNLILVVGTGAGGIQVLLSSRGIKSIGCDAQQAIPLSLVGKSIYTPPELLRFRTTLGTLARESELTSLDFTKHSDLSLMLQRYRPDFIIYDMEPKGYHLGTDALTIIAESGYRGRFAVKFWLTETEFTKLVSVLEETVGLHQKAWYKLTFSEPSNDCYSAFCLIATINEKFRIVHPTTRQIKVVNWGITPERIPLFDKQRELSALFGYLTGGLIQPQSKLNSEILRFQRLIGVTEVEGRSSTSGSTFMQLIASICYLQLIIKFKTLDDHRLVNILSSISKNGQLVQVGNKRIRLTSRHPGFREMITRVIPRIIALSRVTNYQYY